LVLGGAEQTKVEKKIYKKLRKKTKTKKGNFSKRKPTVSLNTTSAKTA
jgi:hypothetical protein